MPPLSQNRLNRAFVAVAIASLLSLWAPVRAQAQSTQPAHAGAGAEAGGGGGGGAACAVDIEQLLVRIPAQSLAWVALPALEPGLERLGHAGLADLPLLGAGMADWLDHVRRKTPLSDLILADGPAAIVLHEITLGPQGLMFIVGCADPDAAIERLDASPVARTAGLWEYRHAGQTWLLARSGPFVALSRHRRALDAFVQTAAGLADAASGTGAAGGSATTATGSSLARAAATAPASTAPDSAPPGADLLAFASVRRAQPLLITLLAWAQLELGADTPALQPVRSLLADLAPRLPEIEQLRIAVFIGEVQLRLELSLSTSEETATRRFVQQMDPPAGESPLLDDLPEHAGWVLAAASHTAWLDQLREYQEQWLQLPLVMQAPGEPARLKPGMVQDLLLLRGELQEQIRSIAMAAYLQPAVEGQADAAPTLALLQIYRVQDSDNAVRLIEKALQTGQNATEDPDLQRIFSAIALSAHAEERRDTPCHHLVIGPDAIDAAPARQAEALAYYRGLFGPEALTIRILQPAPDRLLLALGASPELLDRAIEAARASSRHRPHNSLLGSVSMGQPPPANATIHLAAQPDMLAKAAALLAPQTPLPRQNGLAPQQPLAIYLIAQPEGTLHARLRAPMALIRAGAEITAPSLPADTPAQRQSPGPSSTQPGRGS